MVVLDDNNNISQSFIKENAEGKDQNQQDLEEIQRSIHNTHFAGEST